METFQTLLLVLQVLVALTLIGFILIQHGKGADAGAAFGSGASSTVFGARGSGNFLSRTTTVLAFVFLANSLALGYIAKERIAAARSLMEQPVVSEPVVSEPVVKEAETAPAATTTEETVPAPESDVPVIPE